MVPTIGLKLLHPGENPEFDIVAVHGLNGDAYRTWTYKATKKGEKDVLWLRDLLPNEIQDARIFTYGYDSMPTGVMASASTKFIHHHAQTFLQDLYAKRKGKEVKRPIIFIAHSLGGILVKQALITSSECHVGHNEELRSIINSTYGIMFMGTPHSGSDLASWGKFAESFISRVLPKAFVDTNPHLINTLGRNSEILQRITASFTSIQHQYAFKLFYFWEELKTKLPNGSMEAVVEFSSAVPETLPNIQVYGIHEDHSRMCRFENDQVSAFQVIVRALIDWREAAPDAIELRWMQYAQQVRLQAAQNWQAGVTGTVRSIFQLPGLDSQDRISEGSRPALIQPESEETVEITEPDQKQLTLSPSVTPLPREPEPQFIVPHRPNDVFEGRRSDLDEIHRILQNPRKKEVGNASIVISGISGSGKTHLTRQYVYEYRKSYPGGVFWIESMSSATIELGYWKIAIGLGLTDGVRREQETPDHFIPLVLKWFENNSKWLLVMDGADHETHDEIHALKEVIPGSRDGAIIITSVNNSLAGTARLGSPEGLFLRNLELEQCIDMLFRYARITDPTEEDRTDATELVEDMDRLPLAIHSAGTAIRAMHLSLSGYLRYYRKQPRVGTLTSIHVILDQLLGRYPEAMNLLYILAFVERKVPVKMLEWGIRHCKVPITTGDNRDAFGLSITLGHLLSYSLIERKSVVEVETPGKVDMILLHKVVQDICRERMRKEKTLQNWLLISGGLFCYSFRRMEQRRRDKDFAVSDYRRFQVHLSKLFEHGVANKLKQEELYEVDEVLTRIEEAITIYTPKYAGSQSTDMGEGAQEYSRPKSQFSGSWSSLDEAGDSDSQGETMSGEIVYVPDGFAYESPTEHHGYNFPVNSTPVYHDGKPHPHFPQAQNPPSAHSSPKIGYLTPMGPGVETPTQGPVSNSTSRTVSPRPLSSHLHGKPGTSPPNASTMQPPPALPHYYIPPPVPIHTSPQNSPPSSLPFRPYPPSPGATDMPPGAEFPSAPQPPDRDFDDEARGHALPRNYSDPALFKAGKHPHHAAQPYSRSQGDLTTGRGVPIGSGVPIARDPSASIVPLRGSPHSRDSSRRGSLGYPLVEPLRWPIDPAAATETGVVPMDRVRSEGSIVGGPLRRSPKFGEPTAPPGSEPMSRSVSGGSNTGGGVRLPQALYPGQPQSEPMSRNASKESVASTHSTRYHKLSSRQTLPIPTVSAGDQEHKPSDKDILPEERKGFHSRGPSGGPGIHVETRPDTGYDSDTGPLEGHSSSGNATGKVIEFAKNLPLDFAAGLTKQEALRQTIAAAMSTEIGTGLSPAEYLAASRRSSAPGAVQDPHHHTGQHHPHQKHIPPSGAAYHFVSRHAPSGGAKYSPPSAGSGSGPSPASPASAIFSRSPSPASIIEAAGGAGAAMQRSISEPQQGTLKWEQAPGGGLEYRPLVEEVSGAGLGSGLPHRSAGSLRKIRGASPLGKKSYSPREAYLEYEGEGPEVIGEEPGEAE